MRVEFRTGFTDRNDGNMLVGFSSDAFLCIKIILVWLLCSVVNTVCVCFKIKEIVVSFTCTFSNRRETALKSPRQKEKRRAWR